ncbi:MAG: serine hydrolase [Defluviitaleaceae bacterium]|nr:serine hydrolase [Defluviitaleaceae bacterium]
MKQFIRKSMALLLVLIMAGTHVVVANTALETQSFELSPIRVTMEALGGEVEWDTTDRSILITLLDNTFILFADSQNAYVNNETVTLQNAILIENGISYMNPDDFLYMLMRAFDLEIESHLSGTMLEAHLLAPMLMELFSVPGMVVAIVDSHETFTWIQGFGYADTTQGIPVEEDTVFGIASISKPFTALAVMQLVESGIIDLDIPIVEYLPDFHMQPSPTLVGDYRNITARMLLTHTSGLSVQFHLSSIFDYDYFSLDEHSPEFLNLFLDNLAQYYMENLEGEVYSYSNNGYILLGILVAAMTGDDNFFDDFVRYTDEHIFAPAGMTRSSFILDDSLMPYLARPYDGADTPDEYIFPNGLPTGSMVSTAYDMARFMHIVLDDDGKLIAPGTIRLMMQPHDFDFSNVGIEYGLGFARFTTEDGFVAIGHNGQWHHYNAYMLFDVDSGLGVFVANNSTTGLEASNFMAFVLLQIAIIEQGI